MLAGTALVFTLLYALPAGIISALNRNKWIDHLLRAALLCRRVHAIILVRPCTDLYLWS